MYCAACPPVVKGLLLHAVNHCTSNPMLQMLTEYDFTSNTCCCRGRKREENRASLDGILDALNLNGSNPIAVMTQDITRSFLAGSNEKSDRKKFDIYMEATLMAQSQENYQVSQQTACKIQCLSASSTPQHQFHTSCMWSANSALMEFSSIHAESCDARETCSAPPHSAAHALWICLQIAKADLQKIADSINQAQSMYKQLKARREELSRAVEALKLMNEWQASLNHWQISTSTCTWPVCKTSPAAPCLVH